MFVGMYFLASLAMNTLQMLIWAIIVDVIDYNEITTGKRDDGTIYGMYSFSRKIGQALAGGLGGFVLTFIGYNSVATVQSAETIKGIYAMATLFPAAGYILIGLILMFAYPLTKKAVNENAVKLAEKRKA